jgi:hypothetical protein
VIHVGEGLAGQAAIQDLFRILGKINDSVLSDDSGVGKLYASAYKCTKGSLLERHPNLWGRTSHNSQSKAASPGLLQHRHGNGDETQDKGICQEKVTESSNKGSTKLQASVQSNERPSDTPTSVGVLDQVTALSQQLLDVSEAIICEFIPNGERSLQYHAVCERFWGTTDEILRVRAIRFIRIAELEKGLLTLDLATPVVHRTGKRIVDDSRLRRRARVGKRRNVHGKETLRRMHRLPCPSHQILVSVRSTPAST